MKLGQLVQTLLAGKLDWQTCYLLWFLSRNVFLERNSLPRSHKCIERQTLKINACHNVFKPDYQRRVGKVQEYPDVVLE